MWNKGSVVKKVIIAVIILVPLIFAGVLVWQFIKAPLSFDGTAYSINGIDVKEDDITNVIQVFREKNNLVDDKAWEQAKLEKQVDSLEIRSMVIKDLSDMYTTEVIAQKFNIEISDQEVDFHIANKTNMYNLALKNKELLSWCMIDYYSEWDYVKNELLKAKINTEYVYKYECDDKDIDQYLNSYGDSLRNAQSYSLIAVSKEVAGDLQVALDNIKYKGYVFNNVAFNMYILNWTYSYAFPSVVYYNNTYALPKSIVMALPQNLQVGQVSDVIFNNGFYFIAKYEGQIDVPEQINSKDDLSEKVLEQIKLQINAFNAEDIIYNEQKTAKEKLGFKVYFPYGELPY